MPQMSVIDVCHLQQLLLLPRLASATANEVLLLVACVFDDVCNFVAMFVCYPSSQHSQNRRTIALGSRH